MTYKFKKANPIIFLILLSVLIFSAISACDNSAKKKVSRHAEMGNLEKNRGENDGADVTEDMVIDKVFDIPEVKERAEYIKKETNDQRNLKIWIAARPNNNDDYYWVKAGEDNGMSLVTHFDFYVYPKTMSVKFYDVVEDKVLSLSEWRKSAI